jgi:acetolactate synthase-1/2/3 large subunit
MATRALENVTVSDAYLALLADRGVDHLFGSAGTDFAPIIEALARARALGLPHPRPVTCPHENTAQHMAIGYYLATGRPALTMHHVNVGTANALNGLLNAARGPVPMLFTAGRTPLNEDTLKGHRTLDIHWTQEMFDQAAMARESVKRDYELRNAEQLVEQHYEKLAEVSGGYGERVTEPGQLLPALERAMKAVVVNKRQALLNVVCDVDTNAGGD